jgi:pantoate--beta-alanine ligase
MQIYDNVNILINIGGKKFSKNSQSAENQTQVIVYKTIKELQNHLFNLKVGGKTIGFVPTMGALHQGHISLIQKSLAETNLTVCSIFVNPTQFNNSDDLDKYPRTAAADLKLLAANHCDIVFMPSVYEMYPNGFVKNTEDYGAITRVLEGEKRPGHFDGVITVVGKLFEIINPNKAFFGQKDFQQCMVVNELIKKHHNHIQLCIEPTIRQDDGLALSSRNTRLSTNERQEALNISKVLFWIKENWGNYTIIELKENACKQLLVNTNLKIEYLEICEFNTLLPLSGHSNQYNEAVILTAVFCGEVRLIDNIIVKK